MKFFLFLITVNLRLLFVTFLTLIYCPNSGGNYIHTTALQSDGKIIIGGGFTSYNGTARNRIARLNADGSLDTTFNPEAGANGYVYTAALQSDGKIIIGGEFTTYNGTARNKIARLNTDGSLDVTFNPGTGAGANSWVYTATLQSNGKIIISGGFTSYNGTARNNIARLNADGSLDTTFNQGAGANSSIYTAALQSDGKIIIGGYFTSYNGTARNKIARLNADGSLDGFNPGTGANNIVGTAALQSDGKIIIGGYFTSYNGTARNKIARLYGGSCNNFSVSSSLFTGCSGQNNAVITVSASGGFPPNFYNWSTNPIQTTASIDSLLPGSYSVTVTDSLGCSLGVNITITNPAMLSFSTVKTDITCKDFNNGIITITDSGGTGIKQYSIDNGITYQSSNIFNSLAAGTYDVVVKDSNNCVASSQNITIINPAAISFSTSKTDVACNGASTGSITITASGGTGSLQYSKNNGSTYQTSNLFNNLAAGIYQVVVKDANNCVTPAQTVTITEPPLLSATATATDEICNGSANGTITVTEFYDKSKCF